MNTTTLRPRLLVIALFGMAIFGMALGGCNRGQKQAVVPNANSAAQATTGAGQNPADSSTALNNLLPGDGRPSGSDVNPPGTAPGNPASIDSSSSADVYKLLASLGGPKDAIPLLVDSKKKTVRYSDGKMKLEVLANYYANGLEKYDGPYKEWHPNGQLWSEGLYKLGHREGLWQFFGENGRIRKSGNFKDGLPDGTWEVYREDGTKWREENWSNGKRHGVWKFYDDTGKHLIKREEYKNGVVDGTWTSWYSDGQKASEEHFVDGKRHGTQSNWYSSGKPRLVAEFRNGKQNGRMTAWKENGDKVTDRLFRDGEPINEHDSGASGSP